MNDDIKNMIQNEIDNNEVCLFMKGTPDAPQCGFSMAIENPHCGASGVPFINKHTSLLSISFCIIFLISSFIIYFSFVLIASACSSFPILPLREL